MAFALTKPDRAVHADLIERLQIERRTLAIARETAQKDIDAAIARYNDAIRVYDDTRRDAAAFVDDVVQRSIDEFDSRSDTWRAGEKGEAAQAFIYDWERVVFDEVPEHDDLTLNEDEPDHDEQLADAPLAADAV